MLGKELDDLLTSPDNVARWKDLEVMDDGLRNKWEPPYLPTEDADKLAQEYNELIKRSELNTLHLVIDALVDRLQVVGFRNGRGEPDEKVWSWWQKSSLDQRQILPMRDAAALRDGFVLTVPGKTEPGFKILSPQNLAVEYDPYDPMIIIRGAMQAGDRAWMYLADAIVAFELRDSPKRGSRWREIGWVEHTAGECPLTRFPNNLDSRGRSMSEIESVLPVQRRIHQSIMDRLLLQRSQAWLQRWASGVVVERDSDGNPINPFKTGSDRILIADGVDVKFGEFQQADLTGLLRAVDDDIRAIALITRTPPHYLPTTSISNISGETLTALEAALESRVNERRALWGEAWEHAMRMGGKMVGVEIAPEAEVIWANLELRSEAQRVDAATKLHAIGVPLEYLLERLSLTPPEIKRVMKASKREALEEAKAQAAAFGNDGIEGSDANLDAAA